MANNILEVELETARKLWWLLMKDAIYVSGYNEDTGTHDGGAYPRINCSDARLFVPGADSEKLDIEDIDKYIETVKRWPNMGSFAWCVVKKDAKPHGPLIEMHKDEYENAIVGVKHLLYGEAK